MSDKLEAQIKAAEAEWLDGWQKGPTRLRWDAPPVQVGDPAPDLTLSDTSGKDVKLSDLWKQKPLMIIFWRHFGCSCGVDRAGRLQKEYADYVAAGGQVVMIGQGEAERAAAYAEKYSIPCTILCDPDHKGYIAFGLLEGTPAQVLFDAPDEFLKRDYATGIKFQKDRREQGRWMVDSPWQLPGEFVIDRQGIIKLAYRYNFCEDWPDHRVPVAALRQASGQL